MNTNLSGTDGVLEGSLVPSTGALNGYSGNDHQELPQIVSTGSATNGNVAMNATFELTDRGNSRRIVHYHGHELRYCQDMGLWLFWDQTRWTQYMCEHYIEEQIMMRVPDHILEEANTLSNHQDQERYRQWAVLSQDRERIDAMTALAKSEPELVVQSSQLDSDPYVLNVQNGTLDLLTYELLPHNPADLITRITNTEYDPEAECPAWEMFIDSSSFDEVSVEEIQQLLGRCLTGYRGHKIVYCYGPGGSGKHLCLTTFGHMLGDYAMHAPQGMVDVKKHKGMRSELAYLRGTRFALTEELRKDKTLNAALVDTLPSTRTKIVARSSGNVLFKFVPTHKLWAYSRYDPELEDDDRVWRNVGFVHFDRVRSRLERCVFTFENFSQELPGILNWAMQGL